MLVKEDIERRLKECKQMLKETYNVEEIGIFGSYARGEETEESDIDILVEFNKPIGWEFVDLKQYLEQILGKDVDLVTKKALKPQIKDFILKEVIYQ